MSSSSNNDLTGGEQVIARRRLDARGRVSLPKVVLERLAMQPGEKLDWRIEDGRVVLGVIRKVTPSSQVEE